VIGCAVQRLETISEEKNDTLRDKMISDEAARILHGKRDVEFAEAETQTISDPLKRLTDLLCHMRDLYIHSTPGTPTRRMVICLLSKMPTNEVVRILKCSSATVVNEKKLLAANPTIKPGMVSPFKEPREVNRKNKDGEGFKGVKLGVTEWIKAHCRINQTTDHTRNAVRIEWIAPTTLRQ